MQNRTRSSNPPLPCVVPIVGRIVGDGEVVLTPKGREALREMGIRVPERPKKAG